jgi:hypothetical protein
MIKLCIYIPTYGRPDDLSNRLNELSSQCKTLNVKDIIFYIVVSVNHDYKYNLDLIRTQCDKLIFRELNIGADLNINYGFYEALQSSSDYLWIIGDDEPISNTAIARITDSLLSNTEVDLLVGSKNFIGTTNNPKSLLKLNDKLGRTLSFISSTIYKVQFRLNDVEKAGQFSFTCYSHLAMLHLLISRNELKTVLSIDIQELCDYHYKVLVDPLKPRSDYGRRDSKVFFGKLLSALVTDNSSYISHETKYWWLKNWHRVSMFLDNSDFLGFLVLGIAGKSRGITRALYFLSLFPYWKLKDLVSPVSKTR